MTPVTIRPEWYLLAPYQMLKIIPNKFLGIIIQLALFLVFLLWPFFDTEKEKNIMKRPLLRVLFLFSFILWLILMFWGGRDAVPRSFRDDDHEPPSSRRRGIARLRPGVPVQDLGGVNGSRKMPASTAIPRSR